MEKGEVAWVRPLNSYPGVARTADTQPWAYLRQTRIAPQPFVVESVAATPIAMLQHLLRTGTA